MTLSSSHPPELSVTAEDGNSAIASRVMLPRVAMATAATAEAVNPIRLTMRGSTVGVLVAVEHVEGARVVFQLDGRAWPDIIPSSATSSMARVPLHQDAERHLLTCVVDGEFLAYLDIRRERWRDYSVPGQPVPAVCVPKWTPWQVSAALDEYRRTQPTRPEAGLDETPRGMARRSDGSHRDARQALHHDAQSLVRLCSILRRQDLLPDYAVQEAPELDVMETLEVLRRIPRLLHRREDGPIRVGTERYTTQAVVWRHEALRTLDVGAPMRILEMASEAATQVEAAGAALLLESARDRLGRLHGCLQRSGAARRHLNEWSVSSATTSRAKALKALALRALGLARRLAARRPDAGLLRGLDTKFRDYDLFQWWCGRELALALGCDAGHLADHGWADAGGIRLIATDKAPQAVVAGARLQGWRDGGVMPSAYRPDFLVVSGEHVALLDAKFRIGESLDRPCSGDSAKEVQAYMEEFGIGSAGILVPAIPSSVCQGSTSATTVVVVGQSRGTARELRIVECAPMLEATHEALRDTVLMLLQPPG